MGEITAAWLLGLLSGARRAQRDHAASLDVIKTLYEREVAYLNLLFGTIAAGAFTIAAALVAALMADLTHKTTVGSVTTSAAGATTTRNLVEAVGFTLPDALLVTVLITLGITSAIALVLNRSLHVRLRRTYLTLIAVYFFLNRTTP